MNKIRTDPNAVAIELIKDKALPHFIRYAATEALLLSPVEAANGFRKLADIFVARAEAIHGVPMLPTVYETTGKVDHGGHPSTLGANLERA